MRRAPPALFSVRWESDKHFKRKIIMKKIIRCSLPLAISLLATALAQSEPTGILDGTSGDKIPDIIQATEYGVTVINGVKNLTPPAGIAGKIPIVNTVLDGLQVVSDTYQTGSKNGLAAGAWQFIKSGTKVVFENVAGGAAMVATAPVSGPGAVVAGMGAKYVAGEAVKAGFSVLEWGGGKVADGYNWATGNSPTDRANLRPPTETMRPPTTTPRPPTSRPPDAGSRPPTGGGGGGGGRGCP